MIDKRDGNEATVRPVIDLFDRATMQFAGLNARGCVAGNSHIGEQATVAKSDPADAADDHSIVALGMAHFDEHRTAIERPHHRPEVASVEPARTPTTDSGDFDIGERDFKHGSHPGAAGLARFRSVSVAAASR